MTMSIEEFGKGLLGTNDLDPIYVMLHGAYKNGAMTRDQLEAWCFAYWCFYHSGTCSAIVSAPDFWDAMAEAADNPCKLWSRGTERRHFRGDKCTQAVAWLRGRYDTPGEAIEAVTAPTFTAISNKVQVWPQFGPWIAFKVADMMERVLEIPVVFNSTGLHIYRDPVKGAWMLAEEKQDAGALAVSPKARTEWAINYLVNYFKDYKAPPLYDRSINVQEAETILCKWKSHRNGHYPMGNDTHEIRKHLEAYAEYPLALDLVRYLP